MDYQFLITFIGEIMVSDEMINIYKYLLDFRGLKNTIKEVIFQKKEYLHLFFELCQSPDILEGGFFLLVNFEDYDYLMENIPIFINKIIIKNSSYVDQLSNIFLDLAKKITKDEEIFTNSSNALVGFAKEFLESRGFNPSLNINSDCIDFLNYVFSTLLH